MVTTYIWTTTSPRQGRQSVMLQGGDSLQVRLTREQVEELILSANIKRLVDLGNGLIGLVTSQARYVFQMEG